MSERYTRRDAEAAFQRLSRALGRVHSDQHGCLHDSTGEVVRLENGNQRWLWERSYPEGKPYTMPGAWTLDYAAPYGGYVVHEMAAGGGVSTPFGSQRRTAREFCDAVSFAMDALRVWQSIVKTGKP